MVSTTISGLQHETVAGGEMKKISSVLYNVEPNETVTIKIAAANTLNLVTVSLDGTATQLQGEPFVFSASPEKGTAHILVLVFTFSGSEQGSGSYHLNLRGSEGGTFEFSVDSFSEPVSSLTLMFRVGSAELGGKLGIDPPSPWPHG
jgi:hypothetical protein